MFFPESLRRVLPYKSCPTCLPIPTVGCASLGSVCFTRTYPPLVHVIHLSLGTRRFSGHPSSSFRRIRPFLRQFDHKNADENTPKWLLGALWVHVLQDVDVLAQLVDSGPHWKLAVGCAGAT